MSKEFKTSKNKLSEHPYSVKVNDEYIAEVPTLIMAVVAFQMWMRSLQDNFDPEKKKSKNEKQVLELISEPDNFSFKVSFELNELLSKEDAFDFNTVEPGMAFKSNVSPIFLADDESTSDVCFFVAKDPSSNDHGIFCLDEDYSSLGNFELAGLVRSPENDIK